MKLTNAVKIEILTAMHTVGTEYFFTIFSTVCAVDYIAEEHICTEAGKLFEGRDIMGLVCPGGAITGRASPFIKMGRLQESARPTEVHNIVFYSTG